MTNIEEYIQIVTKALSNGNIEEINEMYERNRQVDNENSLIEEENFLKNKIEQSISNISHDIIIRLLTSNDEDDAIKLYILLKQTMNENIDNAREYIQDFISKCAIFGILFNNILVGIVIVHHSKYFRIDTNENKVPTFYLQELIIHPEHRGRKFSKYLLEYCIQKCPENRTYMSLMTRPDNYAMQNIAESTGFTKQKNASGDSNHSLLMIKQLR